MAARVKLAETTGFKDQSHITSFPQAEAVLEAWEGSVELRAEENYQKYTNCYVMHNWSGAALSKIVETAERMKVESSSLYARIFDFENNVPFSPGVDIAKFSSYKYGIKVDSIIGLPEEVIESILSNATIREALARVPDLQMLQDSFEGIHSILDLKHKLIKAYARDLSRETGDLSFVEQIDEARADTILWNPQLVTFGFISMEEIANLPSDDFDFLFNNLIEPERLLFRDGYLPKHSECKTSYSTKVELQRAVVKGASKLRSNYKILSPGFDDTFIDKVSEKNLELLTTKIGFRALLTPANYNMLLSKPDEDSTIVALNILRTSLSKRDVGAASIEFLETLGGVETFEILFSVDRETARLMLNENLIGLYKSGKATLEETAKLGCESLCMIAYHYCDFIEKTGIPIGVIATKSKELLNAVNIPDLIELYQLGLVDMEILLSFEAEKIAAFNSAYMVSAIKEGQLHFENLRECSTAKLKVLSRACTNNSDNVFDLDHLRVQAPEMIEVIANSAHWIKSFKEHLVQYELASQPIEKARYLTSYEEGRVSVNYFCEISKIPFHEFVDLPLDKLQVLLSDWDNPYKVSRMGANVETIATMPISKLSLLLSDEASQYCRTTIRDLVGMDEAEIQDMIHSEEFAPHVLGEV